MLSKEASQKKPDSENKLERSKTKVYKKPIPPCRYKELKRTKQTSDIKQKSEETKSDKSSQVKNLVTCKYKTPSEKKTTGLKDQSPLMQCIAACTQKKKLEASQKDKDQKKFTEDPKLQLRHKSKSLPILPKKSREDQWKKEQKVKEKSKDITTKPVCLPSKTKTKFATSQKYGQRDTEKTSEEKKPEGPKREDKKKDTKKNEEDEAKEKSEVVPCPFSKDDTESKAASEKNEEHKIGSSDKAKETSVTRKRKVRAICSHFKSPQVSKKETKDLGGREKKEEREKKEYIVPCKSEETKPEIRKSQDEDKYEECNEEAVDETNKEKSVTKVIVPCKYEEKKPDKMKHDDTVTANKEGSDTKRFEEKQNATPASKETQTCPKFKNPCPDSSKDNSKQFVSSQNEEIKPGNQKLGEESRKTTRYITPCKSEDTKFGTRQKHTDSTENINEEKKTESDATDVRSCPKFRNPCPDFEKESKDEIKVFVPCEYEEIKPGIRSANQKPGEEKVEIEIVSCKYEDIKKKIYGESADTEKGQEKGEPDEPEDTVKEIVPCKYEEIKPGTRSAKQKPGKVKVEKEIVSCKYEDIKKKIYGKEKREADDEYCEPEDTIKEIVPCKYEETKPVAGKSDDALEFQDCADDSKHSIKPFLPCRYEETKSTIRNDEESQAKTESGTKEAPISISSEKKQPETEKKTKKQRRKVRCDHLKQQKKETSPVQIQALKTEDTSFILSQAANTSLVISTYEKQKDDGQQKKQSGECKELTMPKLDATLPLVPEQQKDLIGGALSFFKSICTALFMSKKEKESRKSLKMTKSSEGRIGRSSKEKEKSEAAVASETKSEPGKCVIDLHPKYCEKKESKGQTAPKKKKGDVKPHTKKYAELDAVLKKEKETRCRKKQPEKTEAKIKELKPLVTCSPKKKKETKLSSPKENQVSELPDQSPINQCIALCKKKKKAQEGKVPPRDKDAKNIKKLAKEKKLEPSCTMKGSEKKADTPPQMGKTKVDCKKSKSLPNISQKKSEIPAKKVKSGECKFTKTDKEKKGKSNITPCEYSEPSKKNKQASFADRKTKKSESKAKVTRMKVICSKVKSEQPWTIAEKKPPKPLVTCRKAGEKRQKACKAGETKKEQKGKLKHLVTCSNPATCTHQKTEKKEICVEGRKSKSLPMMLKVKTGKNIRKSKSFVDKQKKRSSTMEKAEKKINEEVHDQSPIMQCIALCKSKQTSNTPKVKQLVEFYQIKKESAQETDDKDSIKVFIPCKYEEIKSGIRGKMTEEKDKIKTFVPCKYEEIKPGIRRPPDEEKDECQTKGDEEAEDDPCKKKNERKTRKNVIVPCKYEEQEEGKGECQIEGTTERDDPNSKEDDCEKANDDTKEIERYGVKVDPRKKNNEEKTRKSVIVPCKSEDIKPGSESQTKKKEESQTLASCGDDPCCIYKYYVQKCAEKRKKRRNERVKEEKSEDNESVKKECEEEALESCGADPCCINDNFVQRCIKKKKQDNEE